MSKLKSDLPASLVVFLVAVPLCLGIAVGSGADPVTGLISGIIGGIVVGAISNSPISVSGPAAGLISTVALILSNVPTYEAFLISVFLAGVLQVVFGVLKAGSVVNFVPVSVITGMLAAIGLLLILKQFPHLVGYDADFEGDDSFFQKDGNNTFTEIIVAIQKITPLAVIIGVLGLGIQFFWDSRFFPLKQYRLLMPAPLVVVISGIGINVMAMSYFPDYAIKSEHMVVLPVFNDLNDIKAILKHPDFSLMGTTLVWISALQIAVIASIESLLSVEASDKLDKQKRVTNPNRELIAQGAGNITAGMIGGLPITSVIVRSSVNANSGATSKLSAIFHGIILSSSLLLFPALMNTIPLSALAAILMYTGYKLAKPSVFRYMITKGFKVYFPFLVTILAILVSDLLIGIVIGILVGLYFIIRSSFRDSVSVNQSGGLIKVSLEGHVSFLNKAVLKNRLYRIESDTIVTMDLSRSTFLDFDIVDILHDFHTHSISENIEIKYVFANDSQKQQLSFLESADPY